MYIYIYIYYSDHSESFKTIKLLVSKRITYTPILTFYILRPLHNYIYKSNEMHLEYFPYSVHYTIIYQSQRNAHEQWNTSD